MEVFKAIRKLISNIKAMIVVLFLVIGSCVPIGMASEKQWDHEALKYVYVLNNTQRWQYRLLGLAIILVAALIIYYKIMKPTQCPHCKRYFALKELDTVEVEREETTITKYVNERDENGNDLGQHEYEVPADMITYQVNFVCKKCGENSYKTTFERKERF